MKIFFVIILIFPAHSVLAQFAITCDKDGFCNVRSSPEKKNNIVDKLSNGHLVYCLVTKGNWANIDYKKGTKELNGQVYADSLNFISDYEKIPLIIEKKDRVVFGRDSISVVVREQKFEKTKYKLKFHKEYNDQLQYINGKQYWGTDGEIPKTEYRSIEVNIGTKKSLLPSIAIDNLFEISLYNTEVNFDRSKNILYIQSMNSDGAGTYEVIWKIENGIYKERYIAYGF